MDSRKIYLWCPALNLFEVFDSLISAHVKAVNLGKGHGSVWLHEASDPITLSSKSLWANYSYSGPKWNVHESKVPNEFKAALLLLKN